MRAARAAGAALLLLAAAAANAQERLPQEHEHGGMSMQHDDSRRLLDFPEPMRVHMLTNMRGHLEAMAEIQAALGAGDSQKAARIAETRLGISSPHAAACVKGEAGGGKLAGAAGNMAAMMAKHMPPEMREMGLAMHQAASDFAARAAALKPDDDPRPALAALSKTTQACAACHSAWRLR